MRKQPEYSRHDLPQIIGKKLDQPNILPAIQQLPGHADIATLTPLSVFYKRSDYQEESKIVWSGTREQAWENFYANISVFN
jgi:hypothetical protein